MRLLALDYGVARTGVAVSDETGSIARPLTVVARAGSAGGLEAIKGLVSAEGATQVVVGLPVSLDGGEHGQAREVRSFVARLRRAVDVPVVLYDERFTTAIARQRGGKGPLDARAAAQILEDYMNST
ncbi:MAG: Holliday junction resolvase RuvX [Thermoleophilia bacterium]